MNIYRHLHIIFSDVTFLLILQMPDDR